MLRFERRLHDKPEIQVSNLDSVLSNINQIIIQLMEWVKKQNESGKVIILENQDRLEQALSSSLLDPQLIYSQDKTLQIMYEEEEQFWRQRSIIQWL